MDTDALVRNVLAHGKPLRAFTKGDLVHGTATMSLQKDYTYRLDVDPGTSFDPRFTPALTPAEMLFMGVFEGKYLNDCWREFPQEWYLDAAAANKLSPGAPNVACNYFGVLSRQPLSVWRENGWVPAPGRRRRAAAARKRDILADPVRNPDERGWFQWYCRYWMGRRMPELDSVQIGRWRSFARHAGAVRKRCAAGDLGCSPRERQALLQWAYDPFI